jgi:glyoxylase-like metal-dependent hydrolase (beta-lactamase superfamily II)
MHVEQYVCTVCGYNMVGYYPTRCPFCGAGRERFITSEECSRKFQVKGTPVNENVTRLNSVPALGIEHAAYRVETEGKAFWIDCPSSLDKGLKPADVLMFTHHHFLGASNQYRELFSCQVRIHKLDSAHDLCRGFPFDVTFEQNFKEDGIEAFHIDGHTPGFSLYIFEDLLFICDYVFLQDGGMIYNPYGPRDETLAGGEKIRKILDGRDIRQVCGYNYVAEYTDWKKRFGELLGSAGH